MFESVKQFCKDKSTCSRCVGCNPEGFYQDGELSEDVALRIHGGKFTYCRQCTDREYRYRIIPVVNSNITVICESC